MRIDCIRFLINSSAKGDVDAVARAIAAGVDVNGTLSKSFTTPLKAACWEGRIEVVGLLLKHGASVSIGHNLPLSTAAARGHLDLVQFLLEQGADPNAFDQGHYGQTALMRAAGEAHAEAVRALIAADADVDAENDIGDTPLSQARDYEWRYSAYNPAVDLLYENGAKNFGSYEKLRDNPPRPDKSTIGRPLDTLGEPLDLSVKTAEPAIYADAYEEGVANKCHVEQLMKVVDEGQKELLLADLFHQGANANIPHIEDGCTALGYAVQEGNIAVLEQFLFFDADPDLGGVISPVHEAIQQGRIDILKMLLDSGADPRVENQEGFTPLDIAEAVDNKEAVLVVKHFLDHPPD